MLTLLTVGTLTAGCGDSVPEVRLVDVAPGANHTCAVDDTGQAWCWGDNEFGQLGTSDLLPRLRPARVVGNHRFRSIAASRMHTCAVEQSGAVWCWGGNFVGRLGNGSKEPSSTPVQAHDLPLPALDVSVSPENSCTLLTDASVWCWGLPNQVSRSLWSQPYGPLLEPRQMELAPAVEVVLSGSMSCVLYERFGVGCSGHDWSRGPSTDAFLESFTVDGLPDELHGLELGRMHGCVLSGEEVWCWGLDTFEQVGVPGADGWVAPARVPGIAARDLALSEATSCAVDAVGWAWCWGLRPPAVQQGWAIGEDLPTDTVPKRIEGPDAPLRTLSGGAFHFCGIDVSGALWCFGDNSAGQLGDGSTRSRGFAHKVSFRP